MKEQIVNLLPASFGWRDSLIWYDTIDSTNTRAKELALSGAPHGTVVTAGHQSAGRGRLGRSFQSPAGMGIYMSVILRPACPPEALMHLTCAAGTAMCDAVETAVGFRPGIKWTNDLVHDSRKLGGILTELITTPLGLAAVIGIGINCSQQLSDFSPELQGFAGSLTMVTSIPVDRAALAAAMIEALQHMDSHLLTKKKQILTRYRADCITIGQDVSVLRGNEVRHGHAVDIDDSGALVVRFHDGHEEAVNSGEVSIRGMYGYV